MSGIAGIISVNGTHVPIEHLAQMTESMSHRGVDGIRHHTLKYAALGQCLTYRTAESREGALPLYCAQSHLSLIMDGRVDNWEELRKTLLENHCQLRNRSDAELVLESYKLWGERCFERLDGDFSIAIWDSKNEQLICARDRSSKKPFYYHHNGTHFAFASEMQSLLTLPWVTQEFNEGFIAERLADDHYTLQETCWKHIFRLMQAHYMIIDRNGLKHRRYWFPENLPPLHYKRQSEYVEHYRDIFTDVVWRMSRTDKPLSFEVSGGLDSTSIFACAAKFDSLGTLPAPEIKGHTLNFWDDNAANELNYVDAASQYLNRSVDKIDPAYSTLEDYQSFAKKHKTFPVGPNGFMHASIYDCLHQNQSSVLMCGAGGDEWLTGTNNVYAEFINDADREGFIDYLIHDFKTVGLPKTITRVTRHGLIPLLPLPLRIMVRNILKPDPYTRDTPISKHMKNTLEAQRLKANQEISADIRRQKKMATLFNADIRFANETMEHFAATKGVELRCPFDNKSIIELSFSVTAGRKNRSMLNRDLHRDAMIGILPEAVRSRKIKANFSITYDHHVSDLIKSRDWQDTLINRSWADRRELEELVLRLQTDANYTDRYVIWALFACSTLHISE